MKAEKYHNSQEYTHPPSLRSHLNSSPCNGRIFKWLQYNTCVWETCSLNLASNPGFPFRFLQSCKTKSGTESLGLRLASFPGPISAHKYRGEGPGRIHHVLWRQEWHVGWPTSIISIIWHWGMSCITIASLQPLMDRDYEKGPYDHSSDIALRASAFCLPDVTRHDHTWLGLPLFILQEIKY